MYTFIVQDTNGNYFISNQCFDTKEEAYEASAHIAEYDFIASIDVLECQYANLFSYLKPTLN